MTHSFLIRTPQFLWRGQSSQMLLVLSGTDDRLCDFELQLLHWCHLIANRKKLSQFLHNYYLKATHYTLQSFSLFRALQLDYTNSKSVWFSIFEQHTLLSASDVTAKPTTGNPCSPHAWGWTFWVLLAPSAVRTFLLPVSYMMASYCQPAFQL
jgi:hypothetical protein